MATVQKDKKAGPPVAALAAVGVLAVAGLGAAAALLLSGKGSSNAKPAVSKAKKQVLTKSASRSGNAPTPRVRVQL